MIHKGTKIHIASAEDTLANKLLVGGEQDLKDAEGIYIRQLGKLDMKYLEKICREMKVEVELAELKRRVGRYVRVLIDARFEGKDFFERSRGLYKHWDSQHPVDFLCYTPKEFEKLKNQITIVRQATKIGFTIEV